MATLEYSERMIIISEADVAVKRDSNGDYNTRKYKTMINCYMDELLYYFLFKNSDSL